MSYEFLENITLADVAFEASGRTLEEMFSSAAEALTATMVKDIKTVKPKLKKKINFKAENVEKLLYAFLEELIFLKDSELLLFSEYRLKANETSLEGEISGEKLNMKKHELLVDVKAVTMHMFEVKHEKGTWKTRVVLDV
ncbi:MAG: archease [Candidatus Aenigmarchaeota archaeon]|nr:archease [Candidatus Aenigmarchaeota archaeon]MDI6722196.1 archease [Candidatus Aenigmarchaeota archaeon]